MSLLREVLAELLGMVAADAYLSAAALAVVGASAAVIDLAGAAPWLGGGLLALGCPAVLVASVWRGARRVLRAAR
ncbi:hypothetical protein [Elioraea sp.]|jgi:hypothetical protein|uniref:hypothetical protein n=1 Tax=Elioraea sp. TaxID=2185103 RepID=UPI0021DE9F89|nr:hypothetical protein [Elioraea sp.]GIX08450.1 MAG: hypothetical protein KatS3mg116_0160 [Elioraea sp.]